MAGRIGLMTQRRLFIALCAAALLSLARPLDTFAQSSPPADPLATVNAIYARVIAGKGDGGRFVVGDRAARAKYLSHALAELWDKADARIPKGDVGPIDFDPVTNSQDPDVKSFTATSEARKEQRATVAVTLTGATARTNPADAVIRFDFVREAGQWKVDDIRGSSGGKTWMIRALLTESLKH
jgi:uncharacterized protein DUF3828